MPLVASGILLLRNSYQITLVANIGTTVTALLAALATGAASGMTIALVHLLFNVFAILLIYPIAKIRYIPVILAEKLADVAATKKWVAIAYVGGMFILIPILGIVILN